MTRRRTTLGAFVAVGVAVTMVLAMGLSSFASSSPDGLERVALDKGFAESESEHPLGASPFADYGTSGVGNDRASVAVAGLVGVVVTFAVVAAGAIALRSAARARARPRVAAPPASR